jgi:hypothetical protein
MLDQREEQPVTTKRNVVRSDEILLRQALRPLADVVDPEEGPVILAFGIDQLAYALADRIAALGYELAVREP